METSLKSSPSDLQVELLTQLDQVEKVEGKIRLCLDFMKRLLDLEETLKFGPFWEIRSLCLAFFKEKIAFRTRNVYWSEFIALSGEMRKIKEILDEQSTFAAKQIEIAIEALKKDVDQMESLFLGMDPIDVPKELKASQDVYIMAQQELDFLTAIARRLNSLRQELIRLSMRIRYKNRLLGELSKLGDVIFPLRKQAIENLSERFAKDVESLKPDLNRTFEAKEEIKSLQAFAKVIAINTKTFSLSRERLSGLWDQIKDQEKQRHERQAKQRDLYQESFEKIAPQIDLLKQQCSEGSISLDQAQTREGEILSEMHGLNLGRDEVKALKKRLASALDPLERKRADELVKQRDREKFEQEMRAKAQNVLIENLTELLDRAELLSLDALVEKWEIFVKEEKELDPIGLEKERIQCRLDAVYDHIQEKQWHALRDDSSEEGESQLHALLDGRHKARRKLKEALESHRKTVGGSGLSVEQSLFYQEMIGEEKLRLDAIETMIEELEEKLFDMEE